MKRVNKLVQPIIWIYWDRKMGVISRKLFPACESMCVCCPALRSRSRQPVKRYKKLLAEIFPKSPDGHPNERKIVKLCEYAAKNPFRIPKIAKYLEERCYKELRNGHIKIVSIIAEAYNKLVCMCKEQIAYFAGSLFNVVSELLGDSKQDTVDGTYTHNIENLVHRVCTLARTTGDEHQKHSLKASSLQCLSAMVWFMAEFSHIFVDFDEIVHAALDNYERDTQTEEDDERGKAHHNWVDEVVRCEGRGTPGVGGEFSPSHMNVRPRPEKKDLSLLTREEVEAPKIWAQICIQRMVELGKESTTMRRILDPMFVYFDGGRHWVPQHGLATIVLSDMSYFMENSGTQQLILSGVVRHLDRKNVAHDTQMKSHVIQTASTLALQIRLQTVISDIGFVSDLCRHLRKSLQATAESVGDQELNLHVALQASIENCLLETARGVADVGPLFDMMAVTLEKASISYVSSHLQQVFPEALLVQLLKVMLHPDVEIRIGGHHIFCILLFPSFTHARNDASNHPRRWHSKNASTFASIAALLEKLRGEKYQTKLNKGSAQDDYNEDTVEEEWKHGWSHKNSPNIHTLSSIIDRTTAPSCLNQNEQSFLRCNEDQILQLLSALWIQANLPDNLPANVEAIAHTFCLVLIASCLKNSNNNLVVRFFQLPLSLRRIALVPNNGSLPPAYQRLLHVLSTAMLMFAAKIYHFADSNNLRNLLFQCDVDPYLGIKDDFQVYLKPQSDVGEYGSAADNQEASSILAELQKKTTESEKNMLEIIVESLSSITQLEGEDLAKQLSEGFMPDDTFMFGPQSMLNMDHVQNVAHAKGSPSFDGVCCVFLFVLEILLAIRSFSANSYVEDDSISISSVADISSFIPKVPASPSPSMSHIVSIGQLLESALEVAGQVAGTSVSTSPLPYSAMTNQCESLGVDTRKRLSNWLIHENHCTKANDVFLPPFPADGLSAVRKISSDDQPSAALPASPWLALRLPPASPFDNFLRAARG
ncbi:Uncharacterized protein Adt_26027 [Abeliophyllum distichum]|uniref:ARM repeat superfamily protein n=1 Tax=Abeliophyllum distichum TaxID=126358 RepID=A0ABD1RPP9_9LAMI